MESIAWYNRLNLECFALWNKVIDEHQAANVVMLYIGL